MLADDAYIVRIEAQNAASEAGSAQPWTPDVTAYSLKDGQYVTLDPDDYAFTFYKLDADGNWIALPRRRPHAGSAGLVSGEAHPHGRHPRGRQRRYRHLPHLQPRRYRGVTVESVMRFVFDGDGKAYGPSVSAFWTAMRCSSASTATHSPPRFPPSALKTLEGQRSAVKTVHYTLQRDGLTFYGEATVTLVLLDTSVKFTTEYDHDPQ